MSDEIKEEGERQLDKPVTSKGPSLAKRRRRAETQQTRYSQQPSHFTPKFFYWVFKRWWPVALPAGLLMACLAAGYILYTYEPVYEASALIKIQDSEPYIAFQNAATGGGGDRFVRTQIELMRSVILTDILQDPVVAKATHLASVWDKLSHLRRKVLISNVGGSELYSISYNCTAPSESSAVVDSIKQAYFKRQSGEEYKRGQAVIDLLEKERVRRQIEVVRLRQMVVELSREVTGKDPFGHNTVTNLDKALSPLASLHQSLTNIEVQIEILKAELQSIKETEVIVERERNRETPTIDVQIDTHPEVQKRELALGGIKAQMDDIVRLKKRWQEDSAYQNLEQQKSKAESELATFKNKLRDSLIAAANQGGSPVGLSEYEVKSRELESLQLQQKSLRTRFDKELADVQDSGGKGAELEFAKAELAREERVFEMIAARKLAMQTESKAPPRVEEVGATNVSATPMEAAPWKKLFLACSAALAAPFCLAVLRETSVRRVADAEQLFTETGLRVLGEVTTFPARRVATNPRQLPRRFRRQMFAFAESIDALRMSLTFLAPSPDSRVVAITSAVKGEGKTSVSVALGMSFANATKRRTLIVDGDMRDPGFGDYMDLPEGPGLSDVLAGTCNISEAIVPVPGANHLFVLRAGDSKGAHHHLAQPKRIKKLVSALSNAFSTIVIDTPPVLGASEALSLCRGADVTALCTRLGVSRIRQIRLAADKLESSGSQVVGSVFSGVPMYGSENSYAYGYGFQDDMYDELAVDPAN